MKTLTGVVTHHEREVVELRDDGALAAKYLKAAMTSLGDPGIGGLVCRRCARAR